MSITTAVRKDNPFARPRTSDYEPDRIGSWVAVDERSYPWATIGTALSASHGTGHTVDHLMTAEEALNAANLNIAVRKVPLADASLEGSPMIPRTFATCYDDPDEGRIYFSPVSDKYEVVQPVEALSFFDNILRLHEGAHYSAVWNMREKAMMGLTIEMPESIVVDPGGAADEVKAHILGVNSFDAGTSLYGALTATRWFCMNQLTPFLGRGKNRVARSFGLRHTKNVKGRVADATRLLGVAARYTEALDEAANRLYSIAVTDRQFERIISRLEPFALDGSESPLKTERVMARRGELVEAWRAPHNANITGTRWGVLNIVGEWAEWGRTVHGSARTGTDQIRQRAIGTLVSPHVTKVVNDCLEVMG
jgi:hypothetical protein